MKVAEIEPKEEMAMLRKIVLTAIMVFFATTAWTTPPPVTIVYQPMTGDGFAAGSPFEAWVYFDRAPDPTIPGYAFPEGTTIRFKFPEAFMPQPDPGPQAELLNGGPHGLIQASFVVGIDPRDPRIIEVRLTTAVPSGAPGLKAIHLRSGPLNPSEPGEYPITIEYSDAGELSGVIQAIARITPRPAAGVAAWNIRN
jgi:hypothetical protein